MSRHGSEDWRFVGDPTYLARNNILIMSASSLKQNAYSLYAAYFLIFIMSMCTATIIMSVVVLYFHHHRNTKRAPRWLRKVLLEKCAFVLFMSDIRRAVETKQGVDNENEMNKSRVRLESVNGEEMTSANNLDASNASNPKLAMILSQLRAITTKIKGSGESDDVVEEWQSIAAVTDRILFFVACLGLMIGSIALVV